MSRPKHVTTALENISDRFDAGIIEGYIKSLESRLEPKLQAYVIRDDEGNIKAYTDDTGRLCIGTLEEQDDE